MKTEDKLTEEVALQEFSSWCELNDIDHDVESMSEEDKKQFENITSKIIKAIKKGSCIVDSDKLVYTLGTYDGAMSGMQITVSPPTGKMYLGMDGYKDNQQFHKLQGAMSAITGVDTGVFAKMTRLDWGFFQSVATLFLTA